MKELTMNTRKLFYSKNFFLFNLILVGVLVGFTLSFFAFGVSLSGKTGEVAHAQERPESWASSGYTRADTVPGSFHSVAVRALPSVVELKVTEVIKQSIPQQRGWPWDFLQPEGLPNGNQPDNSREREFKTQGLGSGVIVRHSGNSYYILTNNHVAGEADEITAVLNSDEEYPAEIVGKDPRKDLAIVKITTGDVLPVAALGNSDELRIGDWVLAVGSPFGFVSSVTAGIVSAKGRSGPADNISDFIQTDAAINRGNSGGALVNVQGEVIGINTWIAAPSGGNIGLGFAIPINNAKQVIDQIISTGKVEYGWLGVSISGMNAKLADKMDLPSDKGAFIHNVYIGSPADRGGILPGDFITEVDGKKINNREELVRIVGNFKVGERVDFKLYRYGIRQSITVRIGERADNKTIQSRQDELWPGVIVVPLEEHAIQELDLDGSAHGVLVANVEQKSKAYIGGLRPYDLITEINEKQLTTLLDFYRAINSSDTDEFKIGFIREGNQYFVGITR